MLENIALFIDINQVRRIILRDKDLSFPSMEWNLKKNMVSNERIFPFSKR